MPDQDDVTRLLEDLGAGDEKALDQLFAAVYDQLHEMAHGQRRRWRGEETLNTTALIHEAYLKLSDVEQPRWGAPRPLLRRRLPGDASDTDGPGATLGSREARRRPDPGTARESYLERVLAIDRGAVGGRGVRQAFAWREFGRLREAEARSDEAIDAYRRQIDSLASVGEPNHRWIEPLHALGRLLAESDPVEAVASLEHADSLARKHLAAGDPVVAEIEAALAALRASSG